MSCRVVVFVWTYVLSATHTVALFPGLPIVQLLIGEGRPGPFYHVNDISVYQGRQRGGRGPQLKGRISRILILSFEPGAVCSLLRKCLKLQHLGQKLQGWGAPPLHSPI